MERTLSLNRNRTALGVPLVLFGALILLMKSSSVAQYGIMNLAVTVDLLLTVPVVYLLLLRRTQIPKTTVVPVMITGLLLGSYFLPLEGQYYLTLFKTWALPVIELTVLVFVLVNVRTALRKYKSIRGESPDFFEAVKSTCYDILPKRLVLLFATEVAVIYYGFFNWKPRSTSENEFTYHKKSGTQALFGAFIFVLVIEAVALHFLIARWSIAAAWALTALSMYTAIQVLSFAKSLSMRPISFGNGSLHLKYGFLKEADIPFSDIERIELSNKPLPKAPLTKTLSPLGEMESHNVVIQLKEQNELIGIYGIRKRFQVIGLHVDQPKEFKEKIDDALQQWLRKGAGAGFR